MNRDAAKGKTEAFFPISPLLFSSFSCFLSWQVRPSDTRRGFFLEYGSLVPGMSLGSAREVT